MSHESQQNDTLITCVPFDRITDVSTIRSKLGFLTSTEQPEQLKQVSGRYWTEPQSIIEQYLCITTLLYTGLLLFILYITQKFRGNVIEI